MASLPTEIWERVIDWCAFVAFDPRSRSPETGRRCRTLLACALTCQSWLPRSRYQILSIVSFGRQYKFTQFVLALNSNAQLRALVHELEISQIVSYGPPASRQHDDWINVIPPSLPSKLPKLQSMVLVGYPARALHPSTQFATVTTLSIRQTFSASIADLVRLVLAFPNLVRLFLVLETPTWTTNSGPQQPLRNAQHPRLEMLSIRCQDDWFSREVMEWLTETPTISSLVHFTLEFDCFIHPAGHREVLRRFLQSCVAALDNITIRLPALEYHKHFDFSCNENLRTIELRGGHADYLPDIAAVLSTVTSRQVDKLTIHLYALFAEKFDTVDWKSLESVLSRATFHSLTAVNIMCCIGQHIGRSASGLGDEAFKRRIMDRLHALHVRGILRVFVERSVTINSESESG